MLLSFTGSALEALGGGHGHAWKRRRISAVPRAWQIAIQNGVTHRNGKRGAARRRGGPAPSGPVPVPTTGQAAVDAPIAAVTASTPNAPIAAAPKVLVHVASPHEANPVTSALAEHECVEPHHTPGDEPPSPHSHQALPTVCGGADGGAGAFACKAPNAEATSGAQATGTRTVHKGATGGGTAEENAPRASTTPTDAPTSDEVVTGGETTSAIAPRAQTTGQRPTGEEVTSAQSTGA